MSKTKKTNGKGVFGYERLLLVDPFFLEPGELEKAREQHELMNVLLWGTSAHAAFRSKQFIDGEVVGRDSKGFYVSIGQKQDAYCPFTEAGDIEVGTKANFWMMTGTQKGKENLMLLSYVQACSWRRAKELEESGEVVEARVFSLAIKRRNQQIEGVRIVFTSPDMKGIRGFIPTWQLSAGVNPKQLVDTTISVKVKKVDAQGGGEFGSLLASQKEAELERCKQNIANIKVGDVVKGKVLKFIKAAPTDADSSALVDLGDGVIGLLHKSEIPASGYAKRIEDALAIGSELELEVRRVQPDSMRVSLSLKSLFKKNTLAQLEKGLVIENAEVLRANIYGYFVAIGGGLEGLLHKSNLSQVQGKVEEFHSKDKITVVVLDFQKDGSRISLGRKQLENASIQTVQAATDQNA